MKNYTINATEKAFEKKFLNNCRAGYQQMHRLFGFDFCKEYHVARVGGTYTINKLIKTAESQGFVMGRDFLMVATKTSKNYYASQYRAFVIDDEEPGKYYVDFKVPYMSKYPYTQTLEHFFAKGDVNEVRKDETAVAYLFWQSKDVMNIPKPERMDLTERFNIGKVDMYYTSGCVSRYVGAVELMRREGRGERFTYKTNGKIIYGSRYEPESIGELFDKSGYYVKDRRDELKRKAAGLRADRAKAAFMQTDNTARVEELRRMIEARKMEIVAQLTDAHTSDELKAVENALAYFRGLGGIAYDFELYAARIADKAYPSIDAENKAYNAIKAKLESAREAA